MNIDRKFDPQAIRRARGRRLAWLVVCLTIASTFVALGAMPMGSGARKGADERNQLPQPWTPVPAASLSDGVDWDAVPAAEDPSPLSVAAYER